MSEVDETLTLATVISQLDEMYEGVTQERTSAGELLPPEGFEAWFRGALERGARPEVFCVNAGPDNDSVIVALTGNGKKAEANARFLSHVLNNWPAISEAIRSLAGERSGGGQG